MSDHGSRRAIIAAFLANLGIAIAKLIGFAVTGATSMLAEGVHSLADTGNQGLLLLGQRRGRRDPSETHPFGYGRERYFWAFLVAVVLFTIGAAFSLYEGVEKLLHPHELESAGWAIGVLLVAIVLESLSLRTAVHEATPARGRSSWRSFIKHSKSPELPVVLLEDVGALLGLAFALAGVGLAEVTGNSRFDAVGSVAIGLLLAAIAVVLGSEMRSLLVGEAAGAGEVAAITAAFGGAPGVRRLIHMRTLHLGPDELLVAAKVELDPELSTAQVAAVIDEAERLVRDSVPIARVIYVEPDVFSKPVPRQQRGGAAPGGA